MSQMDEEKPILAAILLTVAGLEVLAIIILILAYLAEFKGWV